MPFTASSKTAPSHPVLLNPLRPLINYVADLLQFLRFGAGQESIVQCLVGDLALVQLPLGPLVPVQAQFNRPRRITADLDEQRTKVLIINVEVVVVDVDC